MLISTNYTPISAAYPMKNLSSHNPNFRGKEQIAQNIKPQLKRAAKATMLTTWIIAGILAMGEIAAAAFGGVGPVTKELTYRVAKFNLEKRGMSIPGQKGSNDYENILFELDNMQYGSDPQIATIRKWQNVQTWEKYTDSGK